MVRDPLAPKTYIGPGGATWHEDTAGVGRWHDADGTPFPDLPEGWGWRYEESFNHEFPEAPTLDRDAIARYARGIHERYGKKDG